MLEGKYVSLATFRRNGEVVATPVWFVVLDDACYVFTASDAGKAKRLRHTARVRIAPCTVRGRVTGEWSEAQAFIVDDPAEIERAHLALRAKYGLAMRITNWLSRLTGRIDKRAMIRIEPVPA